MFDAARLKTYLLPLCGWHQNEDATGIQITAELEESTSSMYFNDEDPLLTIESLLSVAPDFKRITADQSELNAMFSAWLKRKTEAHIIKTISDWTNSVAIDKSGKNLIERRELFTVANRNNLVDAPGDSFCCFEIRPSSSRSVLYTLDEIGIQLTANQALNIYLFHSRSSVPIVVESFTYNQEGSVQWFKPTTPFQLSGEGNWYVGYFREDLVGQSINGVYDHGYSTGGAIAYPTGDYFIAAGAVTPATTPDLWDISNTSYTNDTNYGLNLRISARCDYTDLIIEQARLFAPAILKGVALGMMKELHRGGNARTNRLETAIDREDIQFEIVGNTQGRDTSLSKGYYTALKAIGIGDTMIDPVCNCKKSTGVRYTTMP